MRNLTPVLTPTPEAYVNVASDGFFEVAGITLLESEGFSACVGVDGDEELIANERFSDLTSRRHHYGRSRPSGFKGSSQQYSDVSSLVL